MGNITNVGGLAKQYFDAGRRLGMAGLEVLGAALAAFEGDRA